MIYFIESGGLEVMGKEGIDRWFGTVKLNKFLICIWSFTSFN